MITVEEADRVDLGDIAEIEIGGAGIRITWRNGDREFWDGGQAIRLLERWKQLKGAG